MALINSPVPQVGVAVDTEEVDATNWMTEVGAVLNGGLEKDNLSTGLLADVVPPIVTSLPAFPEDGDRVNFLASAPLGLLWVLRYREASASPYKWEWVGGSPLRYELGNASTASGGYVSVPGLAITVPLKGDFLISVGARMAAAGGTVVSGAISSGTTDDRAFIGPAGGGLASSGAWERPVALPSASTVVAASMRVIGSNTVTFNEPFLKIQPVRVG